MLTTQAAVNAVVMRTFLTASVHILEPSSQLHRPRSCLRNRDHADSIHNQSRVGIVPFLRLIACNLLHPLRQSAVTGGRLEATQICDLLGSKERVELAGI
jgi:hypothetical protein